MTTPLSPSQIAELRERRFELSLLERELLATVEQMRDQTANEFLFKGRIVDSGGGLVDIRVNRSTGEYPEPGRQVVVYGEVVKGEEPKAAPWRCPRCSSTRWVAASLTGPVEYGGKAIKQCIPCGYYSDDEVTEEDRAARRGAARRRQEMTE